MRGKGRGGEVREKRRGKGVGGILLPFSVAFIVIIVIIICIIIILACKKSIYTEERSSQC